MTVVAVMAAVVAAAHVRMECLVAESVPVNATC
jgi:hypothetical protein